MHQLELFINITIIHAAWCILCLPAVCYFSVFLPGRLGPSRDADVRYTVAALGSKPHATDSDALRYSSRNLASTLAPALDGSSVVFPVHFHYLEGNTLGKIAADYLYWPSQHRLHDRVKVDAFVRLTTVHL